MQLPLTASGVFRRTPIERSDQRVSWERTDRAFFASGACHILAWACREAYPERSIDLAAMFLAGEEHPLHVYACWDGWAFDSSGWHPEADLLKVNADFEGRPVRRVEVSVELAEFCRAHIHRMPHQYWQDPRPRASAYVSQFPPPWAT
ncbi:hypothetical protein AB0H43_21055 [Hamadaea sp. NPDC050747]|uniref:hypothetical protein n=1 Tax=Hamadaea sp. NPDC050747 TaxID=3155789 RepID=UPI0033D24B95